MKYLLLKISTNYKENSTVLFMGFSNVFSNILLIISGVLVAQWVSPKTLGLFNSYTLYSTYILLFHFGIPISLGRELPYEIGKGDLKKAYLYAAVAQYYSIALSTISCLILIFISYFLFIHGSIQNSIGTLVIAILCIDGFYTTQYLKNTYRGNADFQLLSWVGINTSLISFISIIFVYLFDFYGLVLRSIIVALLGLFLVYRKRPIKMKPIFDKEIFLELLKKGFPMFLVTQVYSLWPIFQKTIILSTGGPLALGLFSLSSIVESGITSLSGAVGSFTYVNMSTEWGQGKNVYQLFRNTIKHVLISAIILFLIIPIAWLVLPILVNKYIPNFIDGIEASRWSLVTGFIALFNVWTNIYNVVGKQKQKLFSFIFGIIAWVTSLLLLYKLYGFRLEIFPQSMAFGYLVILLYNLIFIYKYRFKTHTNIV
jgi:O-antigen/teichoic acid export membrane protein